MTEQESIKQTLDVIRKALEEDTVSENYQTKDILILNKLVKNDGTIGSEISNTGLDVNDDLALASNHVGANDKLLLIKVVTTATNDLIYGGYVTIQPS